MDLVGLWVLRLNTAVCTCIVCTCIGGRGMGNQSRQLSSIARCQAAQATVFAEMDLIMTAGKFPSDETANRWLVLMGGC